MATSGKILVTGHRGQLGADLMALLGTRHDLVGFDLPELDICNREATRRLIAAENPGLVIHAAAYTDVDGCEANRGTAVAVNGEGTRNVALACKEIGARLIYYSTDYVFDGLKGSAYSESDPTGPRTVYGRSKLAGEEAVAETLEDYAILRVAWVYGKGGRNFVKTMARLGAAQVVEAEAGGRVSPLKVVDDQVGNPSWTEDIVRQTEAVFDTAFRGIYHAGAHGETTWYRFARRIYEGLGLKVLLEPCPTGDIRRPAPRPAMSALENRRLKGAGVDRMRDWEEALSEFLQRHGKELTR
jgi:dTDP-4-dehydrorhamnose reductase